MKSINELAEKHMPKEIFQDDGELWDAAIFHSQGAAEKFVDDVNRRHGVTLGKPQVCQGLRQGRGGWMVTWPTTT